MTGFRLVATPFGPIGLEASAEGMTALWLPPTVPPDFRTMPGEAVEESLLDRAEAQLREYFAGERREFTVPVDWSAMPGGFTGEALRGIAQIRFGEVESYGEIAARLGRPRAARAVGTACSRNPVPLLVPCHRVVRSGGMGVYGGGVEMKAGLLDLEFRAEGARAPQWWSGPEEAVSRASAGSWARLRAMRDTGLQ